MVNFGSRGLYGIDIGGTKVELKVFDETLQPVFAARIDTPQDGYPEFLEAIAALVQKADGEFGRDDAAIGIALPGIRNRDTGLQLSANVPALNGKPVADDLRERLIRPVAFGNDLQCFALSEANGGSADGYPSMYGAILGTGAGGGYCVRGQLETGFNGTSGEWGHWTIAAPLIQKFDLPLWPCGCGLHGCVERYVSGSGLVAIHRFLGGATESASDTLAQQARGDAVAMRAADVHLDLLAHSLAAIVLAFDPHVIVLGGGLSRHAPLYDALPGRIADYLFKGVRVPPLKAPKFGDAGGARGAALLALDASRVEDIH